jgi:hypothetical protein
MPLFPASNACQVESTELPKGVTAPIPVITTLLFDKMHLQILRVLNYSYFIAAQSKKPRLLKIDAALENLKTNYLLLA